MHERIPKHDDKVHPKNPNETLIKKVDDVPLKINRSVMRMSFKLPALAYGDEEDLEDYDADEEEMDEDDDSDEDDDDDEDSGDEDGDDDGSDDTDGDDGDVDEEEF